MASLVTYIRQSEVLLLSHFLATYIHLRNLVIEATSMIYIRLSGILSLSFYNLAPVRGVVSNLHSSRRNLVTLVYLIPVGVVVNNLHPSRRNLVTLVSYTRWGCR